MNPILQNFHLSSIIILIQNQLPQISYLLIICLYQSQDKGLPNFFIQVPIKKNQKLLEEKNYVNLFTNFNFYPLFLVK